MGRKGERRKVCVCARARVPVLCAKFDCSSMDDPEKTTNAITTQYVTAMPLCVLCVCERERDKG